MMNIKKRSEEQEEFTSRKIEKSIRSAGVDEKTAHRISEGIKHKVGMKTADVRKHVIAKLSDHDGKASKAYETYKKPAAARE